MRAKQIGDHDCLELSFPRNIVMVISFKWYQINEGMVLNISENELNLTIVGGVMALAASSLYKLTFKPSLSKSEQF
jgi:uncharacterized protein YxjI